MKRFYEMMFTREPLNTGRQIELDITKALCIFFMVVLHVFEDFSEGSTELANSFGNFLMYYLAGFSGAGTFMICMGLGLGYTKHAEPKDSIKRGAIILLLSYVLNLIRCFSYIFFLFPKFDATDRLFNTSYAMLMVDIMQFAGLALMAFGLFRLAKMKPWHMFLVALLLSLGASLFIILNGQVTTGSIVGDGILSLFFPMWFLVEGQFVSFFPFVCYLIFPIAGYCMSFYYKRLKNKNLFFGIAVGLAIVTIVAYFLINPVQNKAGLFRENDIGYYHMYTWDALVDIITSTGLIGICYFISLILPKFMLNACRDISKNINKVYCISWVILLNGVAIYTVILFNKGLEKSDVFADWLNILLGIGIYAISCVIAHFYVKVKELIKNKKIKAPTQ